MKGIIRELAKPGKISVEFTHQKLREFIYAGQSGFKKRLLHEKVAQVMERRLKNDYRDLMQYSKLIHHFFEAGNFAAALKYRLKNLNIYVDYCHELFPEVISFPGKSEKALTISNDQLHKYFIEIEKIIATIDAEDYEHEITEDRMTFLHMKGRHLIRQGYYKSGLLIIQDLADLAAGQGNNDFMLKAYLQLVYYCIQTHNVEKMRKYLDSAYKINATDQRFEITGILLRLYGLYYLMCGEHKTAEEKFNQSILFFSGDKSTSEKYAINIAACYNYLGEIRRYEKNFTEALWYYDKALAISEEKKVYRSYSFFNTCAGQAAMDMGDFDRAFYYLDQAVNHYEKSDLAWRRSVAEAYMALLLVIRGEYSKAYRHLEIAERYASKMKSPYESGLLWRVKAEIRTQMNGNPELARIFNSKLVDQEKDYRDRGIRKLSQITYCYETDLLNN
jgi:tetratricopeptide (TPR) repeat protein